ncbi:MAG: mycothiol synthase [Bifidobacteriaceae bacterium]|jgi:mycothiol synthase|nr:mycothiol synthase [Bifidobacteriaceae bacterium]
MSMDQQPRPPVTKVDQPLDQALREEARALAAKAEAYDGIEAISEAPLLALRDGARNVTHFLVMDDAALAGYAQLDAEHVSAEVVVDPDRRRTGVGTALIKALGATAPAVRIWAHGDLPAAQAAARSIGVVPVRELWEMTVDRTGADLDRSRPEGWTRHRFRTFNPATDRSAWVDLNAAAFANHPEQGKWTLEDLDRRMAELWFDPAALILAFPTDQRPKSGPPALGHSTAHPVQPSSLPANTGTKPAAGQSPVGYVWGKVTGQIGEIYAIGVHPSAQGQRLGTYLLKLGLEHLEGRGVTEIRLFVEADNTPAIAAYNRQGFRVTRRDVQYASNRA